MSKFIPPTEDELRKMLEESDEDAIPSTPTYKMSDHTEEERFQIARDTLDFVVGSHISGVPFLLNRRQIQALFHLPMRSAQRFIVRYLIPLGAVVKMGSKYLVQPWGLVRLLNPDGRCVYCGRGGRGDCEMPKFSMMPENEELADNRLFEEFKASKRKIPKYTTED